MSIETKDLELKLSSLEADGTFEGLLSAYGNVDDGGDVVERGAYRKWLQESGAKLVMCWHHEQKNPIGALAITDTDDGLEVKGKLNLDTDVPTARLAYSMMKFLREHGLKMGMSIGYQVIKRDFKDGIRYLKELRLIEGSLVTTPMNSLCVVSDVKAVTDGAKDFISSLEAIQLWATKYQMLQALGESLDGVYYGNSGREEKIDEARTIWVQAIEAYMEWMPKLLDLWGLKEFPLDAKVGRAVSAATRKRIEAAIATATDSITHLQALLDSDSTSEEEAGKPAPEAAKQNTAEPGQPLHSVLQTLQTFKLF